MRLIIIGASGLIGGALFKLAISKKIPVFGTYSSNQVDKLAQFDMTTSSVNSIIPDIQSNDVVYLLAAYSDPSWIFNHADISRQLNVDASKRLVDDVNKIGARLIFMSSVEVFDGKNGNYIESDTPNPLNLYGRMKFQMEEYIKNNSKNYCIVRTGWNVGWDFTSRCVITLTYQSILSKDAKMAVDNTFSISDVNDTAYGLLKLGQFRDIQYCHLASSPKIYRNKLAGTIKNISIFGSRMKFSETQFSNIPYTEPRARLNHLNNSLATRRLGISFNDPEMIIRKKVELLDARQKEIDNA